MAGAAGPLAWPPAWAGDAALRGVSCTAAAACVVPAGIAVTTGGVAAEAVASVRLWPAVAASSSAPGVVVSESSTPLRLPTR